MSAKQDTPSVQSLAREMYKAFERDTRDNGDTFYKLAAGSPQWMTDVVYDAHSDMLPDDWRYQFIYEAVSTLEESEEGDDLDELAYEIEADVYTADRLRWLASNLNRPAYCDEAVAEYGNTEGGIVGLVGLGQESERREVFESVLSSLRELSGEEL